MTKTALQQITEIVQHMPLNAVIDINQRIGDWIVSGGNENDPYIYQQLRFARRFVPKEGESNG